jgi:hypothetical protein
MLIIKEPDGPNLFILLVMEILNGNSFAISVEEIGEELDWSEKSNGHQHN